MPSSNAGVEQAAGRADSSQGQADADGGWETSTELPSVAGNGSERTSAAGGTEEGGGAEEDGETTAGDDELARALEDLDGEILDERVAAERTGQDNADPGQDGGEAAVGGDVQPAADTLPSRRAVSAAVPPAPPPPLPKDAPDARDDCVVARQLREAAMTETDLELREALWKEYERYRKSCA